MTAHRLSSVFELHDTRTRMLEPVQPSTRGSSGQGLLRVYCCGPTVYRDQHVGNLRTFLLADLVRRTAEQVHGWSVRLVQNITDVGHLVDDTEIDAHGEDKVLAEAARLGLTGLEIARRYEERFHRDLARLNCRPADAYPRASEHIELMLDLIRTLVDRGHAYVGGDGSVFFDAASFPTYGEISGNRLDRLRPGHRFGGETDESKRFHADWALWKRAAERRQMTWDSPWGLGYPGWHVECSAMSMDLLGEHIDLHLGGIDLRFPHHEDERAQSNAAVGHEVVRRWVHGEHLLFEGRKMAKSTGNVVLLDDVVARGHDPLAVRLAFLGSRYRTQVDLGWEEIAAADHTLRRWRERVATWAESPSKTMCAEHVGKVQAAFDHDLDTPAALQVLRAIERDAELPDGSKFEMFAHLDGLFGLDLVRDVGRPRDEPALPDGAAELLDARARARAEKDWTAADAVRDELAALGVAVTDTPDGQTWQPLPRA
jgi:cysteinyl-tRNA synthetase